MKSERRRPLQFRFRYRAALLAFATLALAAGSRAAGSREAAVIALQRPLEPPVPESVLGVIERVIGETDTLSVAGNEAIEERLRRQFKDPPVLQSRSEEGLEREAGELLEAVAFGRDDETIARGRAVIQRERLRLLATNRSERASRAFGDTCLFVVRALLHASELRAAREQVRECLRLVPDLTPSPEAHPPDVRTAVATARSELLAKLVVVPAAQAPRRCTVLVQGRVAGNLPLEIELVEGVYDVQTDCGKPGVARSVTARAGKTERVTVAPRVERALRLTRPSVLHAEKGEGVPPPAELNALAGWLQVSELWTVDRLGSVLRVTRWVRGSRGLLAAGEASERVDPPGTLEPRVEAAVARIACKAGGCGGTERKSGSRPLGTAGAIGAGVGAAAMLGSWAAWARYADLDRELERGLARPGFDARALSETERDRDSFGTFALVLTGAGSGLFAASIPFALPDRSGVPWWAWSAGVAGIAAAGIGTRLWIDHGELESTTCPAGLSSPPCLERKAEGPLAPMLVTQGASLAAIPLTYVIRGWLASDTDSVGISAFPAGFAIVWTQRTSGF